MAMLNNQMVYIYIYGDRSKGPGKEFRERNIFIREEWPFPDKGILINHHIYLYNYVCWSYN